MGRDLDAPRIRFNWGYHDAAMEHRLGHLRTPVPAGEHNRDQVSPTYCQWYYEGFFAGWVDILCGEYQTNSDPAWLNYLDRRTSAERADIWQEEFECQRDGLVDCLHHPVDGYIIERALHYTNKAMGPYTQEGEHK